MSASELVIRKSKSIKKLINEQKSAGYTLIKAEKCRQFSCGLKKAFEVV